MSTHTPGPWRVVDVPGEASHIVNVDNFTIVRQGYVSDMDTANARLIAAAPTMHDYIAKRAAAGDEEAGKILGGINGSR